MRPEKRRRCSRVMRFWKTVFGFKEPYRILMDGTFVHHALSVKCNINRDVSEMIGGRCIPVVTSCVLEELRLLGPDFIGSVVAAKKCYRLKCGHESAPVIDEVETNDARKGLTPLNKNKSNEKAVSSSKGTSRVADCFKSIIGTHNPQQLCVAAHDSSLILMLRKSIGVPLIHFHRSQLVLEKPSGWTKAEVAKRNHDKSNTMPAWEKKLLFSEGSPSLAVSTVDSTKAVGGQEEVGQSEDGRATSNSDAKECVGGGEKRCVINEVKKSERKKRKTINRSNDTVVGKRLKRNSV